MKKFIILMLIAVSTIPSQSQGIVKFNPLSLFVMTGNVSFEMMLQNNISVQFSMRGTYFPLSSDIKIFGGAITPQIRYYVSPEEYADGFYMAPFASFQTYTFEFKQTQGDFETEVLGHFKTGLLFGYQFRVSDRAAVDVFIGPQYKYLYSQSSSGNDEPIRFFIQPLTNFGVKAGLNVGFILNNKRTEQTDFREQQF